MRDNGNNRGEWGAGGQIKPMEFIHTEHQLRPFDGFKPEEVGTRQPPAPSASERPSLRLARPPVWAQRDDMPCIGRWDEFDQVGVGTGEHRGSGKGDPDRAAQLCAGCPALRACLEAALAEETSEEGNPLSWQYRFGVRGGLTPFGRYKYNETVTAATEC